MMRRMLAAVAVGCVALAAATAPATAASTRETIHMVGSSTMFRMNSRVAELFGRTTQYKTPVVESTGSGGGFKLFCAGIADDTPDIAAASRLMTSVEQARCADNEVRDIVELQVGTGGVVVVNAASAPDFNLTRRQIWLALAAQVPQNGRLVANPFKTWKEVDAALPAVPIEVYGPPPTSGTHDVLLGMLMEPVCTEDPVIQALPIDQQIRTCMTLREDGAYIHAGESDDSLARRVSANPNSVGIVGFHVLEEDPMLKAATIEGVEPTFRSILDGAYPLVRPLMLYIKGAHLPRTPGLVEFVQVYTGDAVIGPNGMLPDIGLVPLPPPELHQVQDKARALAGPGK